MKRRAGSQVVRGRVYGRFWMGGERRESIPMPGVRVGDTAAIDARCEVIAGVIAQLVEVGRPDRARDMALQLGAAPSQKVVDLVRRSVQRLVEKSGPVGDNVTFKQFGEQWTTGELARAYPDHVRTKKTFGDDKQILEQYVYPHIGGTPVRAVQLHEAELVMRELPAGLSRARRRHVAQAMHRLFKIAVYPAKILKASPLPPGFLPKLGGGRAKQFLYPDEDRSLMACTTVPLADRLFYGMLAREGMRFSEGRDLEWSDVDLERGMVRLDENKTEDPRGWALSPGVLDCLQRWRAQHPASKGPFDDVVRHHPAQRFREEHLRLAGVTRPALFESTAVRRPIVVHDLRATFVTVALANGKTETWVQDRTGHKSTLMIARYRRDARALAELDLGPLSALDEVLVWRENPQPDQQRTSKRGGGKVNGSTDKVQEKPGQWPLRESNPDASRPRILNRTQGSGRSRNVDQKRQSATSGDPAGQVLADRLLDRPVSPEGSDLDQIRNDWHAIEVAAADMAATDSGPLRGAP